MRVEWLEWRKGWLLRSGAFPLQGALAVSLGVASKGFAPDGAHFRELTTLRTSLASRWHWLSFWTWPPGVGRPVRVEWLEWRKGWLLRSGAFPLQGALAVSLGVASKGLAPDGANFWEPTTLSAALVFPRVSQGVASNGFTA